MGADIHAGVHRRRPFEPTLGGRSVVVDETYVKVAGDWTYLYRAVDQRGQASTSWSPNAGICAAARAFFTRMKRLRPAPVQVVTDPAPVYPRVIDDLLCGARHVLKQYPNNPVEADHARLKARLRPMRRLKTITSLSIVAAGHAFVQNLRRGHHELTADRPVHDRVRGAFTKLAGCLRPRVSRLTH